jgi:signal transduction histidine kinase
MKKQPISCLALLLLVLNLKGQPQNTSANVDSLKQLLALAKQDTTKVNLLHYLSWAYMFVYADSGAGYAKQGLQLSKTIGYTRGKLSNTLPLVTALVRLGNFKEAFYYGFKGMQLAQSVKDTALLGWMYLALVDCYREQEDYKEALEYVNKAKQICWSKNFDANARIVMFGYFASIYERSNQPDTALYYAKIATVLAKRNWSGLFLTLGNIYVRKREPDTALYYYYKCILFAKQLHVYIDLVDAYNEVSKVFESKGQMDSSIYYARKSISQEGVNTYPDGALRSAIQLAQLYERKGKKDSVIYYQKLAISLKDRLFDRQRTREAQNVIFDERMRQEKVQQQLAQANLVYKNRLNIYFLVGGLVVLVIVAGGLWRRNVYKQRSYALLQQQKQEIDIQKAKVEKTLAELKSTQTQLIQQEKMASLGELTAGIAHEIQNPLNFVNNFAEVNKELLTEMNEEIEKGRLHEVKAIARDVMENEEKISHHGKRADGIVKSMLQHSRVSSGKKEPTDINALADEYLRLAFHGIRAKDKTFNAKFETDLDKSIGKINVVPQDIGRVLLNLINNAFYAVDEKKRQLDGSFEPCVSVTTRKVDSHVEIKVKDNGNGIPQKMLDKIFQPFFTTKPTGQGTGLGLSLSYDIVTKGHGGELKVNTVENEGSEFIVTLPG